MVSADSIVRFLMFNIQSPDHRFRFRIQVSTDDRLDFNIPASPDDRLAINEKSRFWQTKLSLSFAGNGIFRILGLSFLSVSFS